MNGRNRVRCCEAGSVLVIRNGTGLVFGMSRGWHWVNCFVPLWSPASTSVGGLSPALRLLPSWDSRPVCLLLLQKGCAEAGWPELFCLCLDPAIGARMMWVQRAR